MGRILAGLLAVYLLNISVDVLHPRTVTQISNTINEIESLAELLVEEVAQVDNFFQEFSESDREPMVTINFTLVYLVATPLILPVQATRVDKPVCCELSQALPTLTPEIISPPPQIV